MVVTIDTVLDAGNLKVVWRSLRTDDRSLRIRNSQLTRNATSGAAFEYELTENLRLLASEIKNGTYRSERSRAVEGTKSTLLKRIFTSLGTRDALLFKALSTATDSSLRRHLPPWTFSGRKNPPRAQKRKKNDPWHLNDPEVSEYEGWFETWLRYRGLVGTIAEDPRPYILVSDVTNYFPSVDIVRLRSRIEKCSELDREALDLLFALLEAATPRRDLGPHARVGLPIDEIDASRALAHFYLLELDQQLDDFGRSKRYTRWMDDIVISIQDAGEGSEVATQLQEALSRLGLVPNSSKTRLISKDEYRESLLVEENEFLNSIQTKLGDNIQVDPSEVSLLEAKASSFIERDRNGEWSRVMRRYLSLARRLDSSVFAEWWPDHLVRTPSESRYVFDYLASLSWSDEQTPRLLGFIENSGQAYEDVLILAYELLLIAPVPDTGQSKKAIIEHCIRAMNSGKTSLREYAYLNGLRSLLVFKFGGPAGIDHLRKPFVEFAREKPRFAEYALPIALVRADIRSEALRAVQGLFDRDVDDVKGLCRALLEGDSRASGIVLNLAQPQPFDGNKRQVVAARALPLLWLVPPASEVWKRKMRPQIAKYLDTLRASQSDQLLDKTSCWHYEQLLARHS